MHYKSPAFIYLFLYPFVCNNFAGLITYHFCHKQLVFVGTEFVGPSKRVYAGVVISFSLAFGNMSLSVLALLIRKWRILQLVISAPAFLSLCLYP